MLHHSTQMYNIPPAWGNERFQVSLKTEHNSLRKSILIELPEHNYITGKKYDYKKKEHIP